MPVVDIHTHFFPELTQQQSTVLDVNKGPWLRKIDQEKAMIMTGDNDYRPVYAAVWDAQRRIEEMDRNGIDIQIMCATPLLFAYAKDAKTVSRWAMMLNDAALELCSHDENRLKALSQVPLQDVELACKEVSRAKAMGHVGVQIGNHVGEKNLDDEELVMFLQHCASEEIPVLVHPWDMMAEDRMPKYMLQWLVGMPAETQLGVLSLILSGAFERLSENLKICFAHGGGNFAFQLGRVDNAWQCRDIVRKDCPQPPSSYVNRFYMDSAVFSHESLQLLTQVMGVDRVMLGSDYPFPLGEQTVGKLVRDASLLSQTEKIRVLGENAVGFFNL